MKKTASLFLILFFVYIGMGIAAPTIKTIKPGGGGDYTTLQDWEDWADGQAIGDGQWAECYSGGNLGTLVIDGWTNTPTEADDIKIYAADGEQYSSDFDDGAYIEDTDDDDSIEVREPFVTIDGLRFEKGYDDYAVYVQGVTGVKIVNCYMHLSGLDSAGIYLSYIDSLSEQSANSATVRNNFVYCSNASSREDLVYVRAYCAITKDITVDLEYNNNSVFTLSDVNGVFLYEYSGTKTATLNVTAYNNTSITDDSGNAFNRVGSNGTFTCGNNVSDDDTAESVMGGTGFINNATGADCFVDASNGDLTIDTDSDLYDAGYTVGTFSVDAFGTSRPQGSTWDIGAYEYPSGASAGNETYQILIFQ